MTEIIGPLRARVRLEAPVRTEDELGGAAITWSDEGEVWAEIAARGAGEALALDTLRAAGRYRVSIRARDDVAAGWRVAWDGRLLRIVAVEDVGAPRLALVCEEEAL